MPAEAPYILYGLPHSLYTGKARCYLRNQGIAYIERPTSHPDFANKVVPAIGRAIIPVLQTPSGELIQDSLDIIDHFEAQGARFSVYPESPLLRVVAILIEYYGSQAMLKHAMHYRWSFLDQQEGFLSHAFSSGSGPEMAEKIMQRMQSYLPRLGVNGQSASRIEASYEGLLAVLERHFQQMPYLLGGKPSIADYGLIGPMFAHLGRDPVPSQIMKTRAPRVYRWVERMTAPGLDVVDYPGSEPVFCAGDTLPETLTSLLEHIAEDIFPELTDKLSYLQRWLAENQPEDGQPVTDRPQIRQLGMIKTCYRGEEIEAGVEPYLLYLLERASATLDSVEIEAAARIRSLLGEMGLADALVDIEGYRVARRSNIEVWEKLGG